MFWIVIGVPNIVSLLYFGAIASPVYVSHASMLVFRPAQSSVNVVSMLSSGSGAESFEGSHILQTYIESWTEYQRLAARFDLAKHYGGGDFVSRYGGVSSLFRKNDIALWRFYRRQADVEVNEKNNIVSLQMKAYTAEFAASLAQAVLADAIAHIDAMNQQMDHDYAVNAARSRQDVQSRLEREEAELAEFRGRSGVLDPHQADFKTVAEQNAHYHQLLLARDNDAALLKEIDAAAQQADLNSIRSKYYLQVISPASRPQSPELPRRLEWIAGVFFGSLLLWTLVR